jgi:hypothetical protein
VTACVRSSEIAAMNAWSSEQNGFAGVRQIAGTSANVASSHYIEENGFAGIRQVAGTSANVAPSHYITLLVPDSYRNSVTLQGVHPTYVPFVPDSANQVLYARTDVPVSYPQQMIREPGAIYTTEYGRYYPENTTAAIYSKMVSDLMQDTTEEQLLPQDNSAYLTEQGVSQHTAYEFIGAQSANPQTEKGVGQHTAYEFIGRQSANPQTQKGDVAGVENVLPGNTTADSSSLYDGGPHEFSQTTIASPITVLWLMQNYEAAQGMALSFSTVYKHYLSHCKENKLNPVNQSLFGKLFRSVFLGLKTRRIGTRYNTKYYYYGIRVIPGSALNNLSEDAKSPVHQQTSSEESNTIPSGSDNCGNGTQEIENQCAQNIYHSASSDHSYSSQEYLNHQQFLGQSGAMSDFPDLTFPLGFDIPEDYAFGL